jgi:hypothetical protein
MRHCHTGFSGYRRIQETKGMCMNKKLYAHVLLDRSGSMESCRDSTISAFNEYVSTLKSTEDIDARISLTIFDSSSIDLIRDGISARNFTPITREEYVPRASTPLFDAIGKTVAHVDKVTLNDGENVALVILTDGLENASTEYKKDAIKALLSGRQKDKNWMVIYLGANQDAWATGATFGAPQATTMDFDPDRVQPAMAAAAQSTARYARSGSQVVGAFTSKERGDSKR